MDWYRVLEVVIGSSITILAILVLAYWKGYAYWKSKNEADLEDTGAITRIQETVKTEFQVQVAAMNFENQHKQSIAVEQRNTIYAYHDSINELYSLPKRAFLKLNGVTHQDVNAFNDDYHLIRLKCDTAIGRLQILLNDEQLSDLHKDVIKLLLEAVRISANYLEKLRQLNHQIDKHNAGYIEINVQELYDETQDKQDKSIHESNDIYESIDAKLKNLRTLLKKHIESAINKK